jgi:hypothetical protein
VEGALDAGTLALAERLEDRHTVAVVPANINGAG